MATTTPDNIFSPDAGDDYALTTDLAALTDTVQDAITAWKNYGIGTDAQRSALTGTSNPPLKEGLQWYSTDTNLRWWYDGSAWNKINPPLQATLYRASGTHSIATAEWALGWDTVATGSSTGFWNSTNPTRITAPTTGRYWVSFNVSVNSGSIEVDISVRKNGTLTSNPTFIFSDGDANVGAWPRINGSFEIAMNSGDYLELFTRKAAGTDRTVRNEHTFFQIRLLP